MPGYADIVMKGGIASGVVYPKAIEELATTYNLKNIGGTSVGAIAASIAAAAEFRRRNGSREGYQALSRLPDFLERPDTLRNLFKADEPAAPLLDIGLCMTGSGSFWFRKVPAILFRFNKHYPWIAVIVLALFAASILSILRFVIHAQIAFSTITFLLALILWIVACCIYLAVKVIVVLNKGQFGFCHGHDLKAQKRLAQRLATRPDITSLTADETPPLVDWLDAFIGFCADRPPKNPLTFGDLWNAPPPEWDIGKQCGSQSIDFKMVTTCLTLGRPFEVPFDPREAIGRVSEDSTKIDLDGNERPQLYFKPSELSRYFGPNLIKHLMKYGTRSVIDKRYYRFPAAARTPIAVAARLSMSFPLLFSAVPLYAPDAQSVMREVWFSDGGLSSNFPIHLFDSPIPRWPTFCIDLLGGDPDAKRGRSHNTVYDQNDQVFLEYDEQPVGAVNAWNVLSRGFARGNVLAFFSSIIDAMRTWQDMTLARLPGNSSRTVAIRLPSDEGGLNLNMTADQIKDMTVRGTKAGQVLINRFGVADSGWDDQRWLRYRATMDAITSWLDDFRISYAPTPKATVAYPMSYDAMIGSYYCGNAVVRTRLDSTLLWPSPGDATGAQVDTNAVADFLGTWKSPAVFHCAAPQPAATLRMRPHV